MKAKKLFILSVSITLVLSGSIVQAKVNDMEKSVQVASNLVKKSVEKVLIPKKEENCIIITRATGEIEVYPLEEALEEANVISNDKITTVTDGLTRHDSSDYINYGFSDVENSHTRATSRSFNWDAPGNTISYSTTILKLNKGDSIDFLIATSTGYSCEVGLMDRTNWNFISSGYFGGTKGFTLSNGFTTTENYSSVSFAINNLRDETTNYTGSYTAPR